MKNLAAKKTFLYSAEDELMVDVYVPERRGKILVITLHGGGFFEGTRDDEVQLKTIEALLERGFMVASADYRLIMSDAEKVRANKALTRLGMLYKECVDAVVEDLSKAIRKLLERKEEIGFDRDKIILTGCSAGAIGVLQMDYYRVNFADKMRFMLGDWKPAAVAAYGGAVLSNGRPEYNTTPAPTLFVHGAKDKVVNYYQQNLSLTKGFYGPGILKEEITASGGSCLDVLFTNVGHEASMTLPETIGIFCEFVNSALNGVRTVASVKMWDDRVKRIDYWKDKTGLGLFNENLRNMGLT